MTRRIEANICKDPNLHHDGFIPMIALATTITLSLQKDFVYQILENEGGPLQIR